jgi:hypothetical protein
MAIMPPNPEPARSKQEVRQVVIGIMTTLLTNKPKAGDPLSPELAAVVGERGWSIEELHEAFSYAIALFVWFAEELADVPGADAGAFLRRQAAENVMNPPGPWSRGR